jgi:hypothetical protein
MLHYRAIGGGEFQKASWYRRVHCKSHIIFWLCYQSFTFILPLSLSNKLSGFISLRMSDNNVFYEVQVSQSSSNFLHWLKFIVQSQTQIPSEVTFYIGTTHGIISDYSQFITITSDIQQHCIMLTHFCNHWNNFRVLFPWKLGVRGRRHTDMVLVGKDDTRHEADLGMNGGH